ncbi:DUF7159 family protein [Mycobacterium aquaticum]|uniref:DUF7159 domain-containing protein n=1 Tax=Mycobacterium aquaticum TaxID=1927124 RepID=A0A1X0AFR5_9MYCO|nr:hypothetical protein [Mycobacterium aquaticum]ORA28755.1 hypothetical protein BST13_28005 [Mycobacterium aquaticum]
MDAVLGVSMTGSSVGLVLVEGRDGDGTTLAHDTIDLRAYDERDVCDEVVSAVVQLDEMAAGSGHELRSVGVTWNDYAEREASQVMRTLPESGFPGVVPVRLPQATEALARGIADVVGFDSTVVCVIEPEMVIALTVRPGGGPVRSAVNHLVDGDEALSDWLREVFATTASRPDAVVVVGSAGDLTGVMPRLERTLRVPVFTPAEAELALARGAALSSARRGRFMFDGGPAMRRKRWSAATFAPVAMLAGGVVTFVVSTSVAVSMQLVTGQEPAPPITRPAVNVSGASVAVTTPPRVAVAPEPPAQLVESAPAQPAAPQLQAPEFVAEPSVDQAPAGLPAPQEVPGQVPDVPAAPPDGLPPAEIPAAPGAQEDPATKLPLRMRILGRLGRLHPAPDVATEPIPDQAGVPAPGQPPAPAPDQPAATQDVPAPPPVP